MSARRNLAAAVIVLALLLLPGVALAETGVTVKLDSVSGSGVTGAANLAAVDGGTTAVVSVTGLPAGATAKAFMRGGTCALPSASFATMPDLLADATGKATASGAILFRGTDKVELAGIADSQHIIDISVSGTVVACGVIPSLASTIATPPALPASGATPALAAVAMLASLGCAALIVGSLLRRRA